MLNIHQIFLTFGNYLGIERYALKKTNMIEIGQYNLMKAARLMPQGWYLVNAAEQEVLLPNKYVPEGMEEGQEIKVFIYMDSEDRVTATTRKPKAQVNEFACLKVLEMTKFGAFLDWGLEKDLLVPFSEQTKKMLKDEWHLVYLYLDERTERLVATAKINSFLETEQIDVKVGQEVDLLIGTRTDLGVKVIINNKYAGLIFNNEIFQKLLPGAHTRGFIKQIRPDNKIDVSLQQQGFANVAPNAQKVLEKLEQANGFLALNDKSDPVLIQQHLEMSKKTFKKAIGVLYKQKKIRIESDGIYLNAADKF